MKQGRDFAIENRMEKIAYLAVKRVLTEEQTACDCLTCIGDMQALVLNGLTPDYVGIPQNQEVNADIRLEDLDRDLFNQLMVECYRALVKVTNNPRHDGERSLLHNSQQGMALGALDEILRQKNMDLNYEEKSQVMAYIMNNLEPKYTTTHKGDVYARTVEVDAAYLAKIYAHIFNALSQVFSTL